MSDSTDKALADQMTEEALHYVIAACGRKIEGAPTCASDKATCTDCLEIAERWNAVEVEMALALMPLEGRRGLAK